MAIVTADWIYSIEAFFVMQSCKYDIFVAKNSKYESFQGFAGIHNSTANYVRINKASGMLNYFSLIHIHKNWRLGTEVWQTSFLVSGMF